LKREAAAAAARPQKPARAFIHLRVHSAYSLLEGALQHGAIIGHAVKDGTPAIAVTDTNNLFGALEFSQKAAKDGSSRSSAASSISPSATRRRTVSATAAGMARRHGPWC